jgi:PAS domain S-box-containing protein
LFDHCYLSGAASRELETMMPDEQSNLSLKLGAPTFDAAKVLDSLDDACYIIDRHWRFVFVNQRAERLLHRKRPELIGKCVWTEFPEAVGSAFEQQYRRAVEEGIPTSVEEYYPPLDTWFWVRAFPYEGGLTVVFQDIDVRKRDERRAQQRKAINLESITDAFFSVDAEWNFTYVNDQSERLMARSREDLLGRNLWNEFPEVVGTTFERNFRKAVREQNTIAFEEFHAPLGVWMDVRAYPSDDGLSVCYHDVTDRKQGQEALIRSQQDLQLAVDGARLGTFYCDWPLDKIIWNQTCKEHFFLPHDAEVDIELFYSLLHPDDREHTRQAIERARREHVEYDVEYRTLASDGRTRWINAVGRFYYHEDGSPRRFDGITIDISARKLAEKELRGRIERERFLAGLTERTQFLLTQGEIIAEVVKSIGEYLRVSRCTYIDVNDEERCLYFRTEWARGGKNRSSGVVPLLIIGEASISTLRSGQPLIVPDTKSSEIEGCVRLAFRQLDAAAVIWVPIHRLGKLVSILEVNNAVPRIWTEDEIALLSTLAQRSRLKIENARLMDEVHLRAQRARYLSEASGLLNASLDYEATLATIAKLAVPQFADWCTVDTVDEDSLSIKHVALEHVDPAKIALGWELRGRYPPQLNRESGLGRVLHTGQSTFIPLVTEEMLRLATRDETHFQILAELGLNSVMIVPLAVHDHVYGALSLIGTKETGKIFTDDDLRLAEDIGRRAGLAIENSRLYQKVRDDESKQRRIAETLQMSLMVAQSSANFDNFAVDTHYIAALDESLVGGDFGDVFRVNDKKIALIVGDCTGKGLEAARFVGECQFTTRAFIRASPDEPEKALSRVNQMLLDDQQYDGRPVSALACMAIAVVDTETGAVSIAASGSEPPVVYRAQTKTAEEVLVSGPMLGLQDDSSFEPAAVQLGNGDILVLTTDGITEARNSKTRAFFGYEGLLQSVLALGAAETDFTGFAERVTSEAKQFAAGQLTDDACVIVGNWMQPDTPGDR